MRCVSVTRPVFVLCAALLASSATIACEGDGRLSEFVRDAYGSRIEFDVYRNGKRIGEHITTFAHAPQRVHVESRMQLAVSVFFVPVYRFSYESRSTWCNGRLEILEAVVVDNGKRSEVVAVTTGDTLEIRHEGNRLDGPADLISTDHWDPRVLDRREVLNTITGFVNSVSINRCNEGSIEIETAAPTARCYEYSGDLETRVWYDTNERWVGLEFEGNDGSMISYVCRVCQGDPI
jgi:hypothetical protein